MKTTPATVLKIYRKAVTIFGSDLAAKRWLQTANEVLGGRTPMEDLEAVGPSEVEELLGRIEDSVYS